MKDLIECAWCGEACTHREIANVDGKDLCPECWWRWRDGKGPPDRAGETDKSTEGR